MSHNVWNKASDLRVWADKLEARQKLPALIRKLIHGTVENPTLVQFPADEGTHRRGWDGVLEVANGNAWIPSGKSVWEMGVDQDPATKANSDYTKRTGNPGAINPKEAVFVFVTPRKWEGKTKWIEEKQAEGKWLAVRACDCDDLEQWLETAPPTDAWLARLLGKRPDGVRDLSTYWQNLAATSDPPLTREVFIGGRTKAEKDLQKALADTPSEIAVSALSLSELRDYVSAVITSNDEEAENAATSRALIVETADAWHQLVTTKNRLLLIPSDQLALDKPMVAEAVKNGHCVLTQRPFTMSRAGSGIRLPRADRWEIQKALEAAGFEGERASRLAREAGGCLSVLVRLASKFAVQVSPAWSKPEEVAPLLPLILLGAWSDRNGEDRKLVELFSGQPYAKIQELATRWMNQPDGPLRLAETVYSLVSREDSWKLLSPYFTNDLMNRFMEIANAILSEDDPRFDMEASERYLAGIYKKLPKYSPDLREGVAETIALLGTRGEQTPQGTPEGSTWRAARLVDQLLKHAQPKQWFSLANVLPLLAEAAPDEFLSALEADLQKDLPAVSALFEKNDSSIFSSSPHTNLMWALGLLAWDTTYLARVILVLAALFRLDTGVRTNPRPTGLMNDIFRFWYPQTAATVDERLQVLDILSQRQPDVAWSVLFTLIPGTHDMAMPSSRPRWRDCDTSQSKEILRSEIRRQIEWAAAQLIKIAESQNDKWPLLVKDFGKLPPAAQNEILKWLNAVDVQALSDEMRFAIWEEVRDLVRKHRFFHKAGWAMPKNTADSLAKVEKKLAPSDPIACSRWLFQSDSFHSFGDRETSFEDRERLAEEARAYGVKIVYEKFGLEGVFRLASNSQFHLSHKMGQLVAELGLVPDWKELLPEKLVSAQEHERAIALGYATGRSTLEGDGWVDQLPIEEWSAEAVGEFARTLNFEGKTWQMLQKRKPDAEKFYWRSVRPWVAKLSPNELDESVNALLQHDRAMAAIVTLSSAIHAQQKPSWKTVADAIDLASSSSGNPADGGFNTMSVWELCELMKYLQADPTADQERLVILEWRLLPLARHDNFEPKILHSELSRNPAFFVEVIAAVYRGKDEAKPEEPDVAKQNRAEAGYSLLESWCGIPGQKPDGTIDLQHLIDWVTEARKTCSGNGRIEVCDVKIGEQLSYAPSDANDQWPCQAVRSALEEFVSDEILRGFETGTLNQRGVTTRGVKEGGEQERELAKKYRDCAEKCKVRWPRTGLVLRRLADHYEANAKWHDEHAESRD